MLYILVAQRQAIWTDTVANVRYAIAMNLNCLPRMIIQMCASSTGIRFCIKGTKELVETNEGTCMHEDKFFTDKLSIIQSVS